MSIRRQARQTVALARAAQAEQRETGQAISIGKKHRQPPIAALSDVMRAMRNDNARETSHAKSIKRAERDVNYVYCPRI